MAEFEDKLQNMLADPAAMEQVMSLARGLMGGSSDSGSDSAVAAPAQQSDGAAGIASLLSGALGGASSDTTASDSAAASGGAPDMASMFSKLDPRVMSAAMNVFGVYNKDDHNIRLLFALKPHLASDRRDRIEHAVQILRLSKAVRAVMRGMGGSTLV